MCVDYRDFSPYENKQIEAIKEWKSQEPGVLNKAVSTVLSPLTWLVQKVVPESAIKGALNLGNILARKLADIGDIKKSAGVAEINELKTKDLEQSDKLANSVHVKAVLIASGEGAGAGFFGLPGMAVDIPAIITLSLRTIHKIGMCYGYEVKDENDQNFIYGILSAAGANTIPEKVAALTYLRSIEVAIAKQTWKVIAEKAAVEQFSKEAGIMLIKNLAKQIGVNITKRKALAAIPVVGAAVGGSVNGWYINDIAWSARRAFQERWLMDNGKIIEI